MPGSCPHVRTMIKDDELVDVTPASIRIRKLHLKEHERKTASRTANKQEA